MAANTDLPFTPEFPFFYFFCVGDRVDLKASATTRHNPNLESARNDPVDVRDRLSDTCSWSRGVHHRKS